MYKKLTADQQKIDLVAKLVKEGAIDFTEAIKLLEVEVIIEYMSYPYYPIPPNTPYYTGLPIITYTNVDSTLTTSN